MKKALPFFFALVLLYGCAQKRGPAQRPAAKAESSDHATAAA
jgi:hypothetical protein